MVAIFETFDMIQADILKAQLEDIGIKAHIQSNDVGGVRPSLAFVSPIKVLVTAGQMEEAKKVIKDLKF